MKVLVYGSQATAEYRIQQTICSFEHAGFKVYRGGVGHGIVNVLKDLIKVFVCDVVYVAPFNHSQKKLYTIAGLLRKYIITDYYASFYDMEVCDRKLYAVGSDEANLAMKVDQNAIIRSSRLLFLNKSEQDYYLNLVECSDYAFKASVVPLVIPRSRNSAQLRHWKCEDGIFEIVYGGTYVPLHGIDIIIKAASILKNRGLKFHISMLGAIGADDASAVFQRKVNELELGEEITIDNTYTKQEYYDYCINKCDCMLGIFGNSEKAYTVIANKIIDAISMRIPCVTGWSKGLEAYFDLNSDIVGVEHTAESLAEGIMKVYHLSTDSMTRMINKSFAIYEENFSDQAFDKFLYPVIETAKIKGIMHNR